jgi:LuxR family maltose regulon positive regulatory protein
MINMRETMPFQDQLLETKFFVPSPIHTLILRPRLHTLLMKGLHTKLTVISSPAGFGKTMLLSTWIQVLATNPIHISWLSLEEGDDEPQRFWTYIIAALHRQEPDLFEDLMDTLRIPQHTPIEYLIRELINVIAHTSEQFLLILDDYHLITQPEIHAAMTQLLNFQPPQLHIVVASRTDPPLPIANLRARGQAVEIRAQQLRCTTAEAENFLRTVMGLKLPEKALQNITARTEGWLVGLQLIGLSLQGKEITSSLIDALADNQQYIFDYLTQEVIHRQPPDVQLFLLRTSILKRLTAPLCDAVLQRSDSRYLLEQLDQSNLFIMALDSQRRWYRYHHLFAEALFSHLEQIHKETIPTLHYHASVWFAQQNLLTEAILHAFKAYEWYWAAELIERLPFSVIWGASEQDLIQLRHWLEQLPDDVVKARPRLCLACAQTMFQIASPTVLVNWLDTAEETLLANLNKEHALSPDEEVISAQAQEQRNLLGEVIAYRAWLLSMQEDGREALPLCDQARAYLAPENHITRAQLSFTQLMALFHSAANNGQAALSWGMQSIIQAQASRHTGLLAFYIGCTSCHLLALGQLHEVERLSLRGEQLKEPDKLLPPALAWVYAYHADLLREWNQLDDALQLAFQAVKLGKETGTLTGILTGYMILGRIYLSRGELESARATFKTFNEINDKANFHLRMLMRSLYLTIDEVRLWIAMGDLEQASKWAETVEQQQEVQPGSPFARERTGVALCRILIAQQRPSLTLQRLRPLLQRAREGQREDHILEMELLTAIAHQMCGETEEALDMLAQTVARAEPEGFIRRFVDEGEPIATLLATLREQQRQQQQPTRYLDELLVACSRAGINYEPLSIPWSETPPGPDTTPEHTTTQEEEVKPTQTSPSLPTQPAPILQTEAETSTRAPAAENATLRVFKWTIQKLARMLPERRRISD